MDCPRCELIRDLPLRKHYQSTEGQIILHRTIEELRDGLAASCWWCVAIAHDLQRGWTGDMIIHNVHSFTSVIIRDDRFYNVKMFYKFCQSGSESEDGTSFVYQKLSSAVKLERRTDSSQSWQYIQRRLRDCEDLHKETCGSRPLQNRTPTWLIKIEEQQHSKRRCRLVKNSSEALVEEYVTMSHRWQPELMDEKKLCTSKLGDYQNCIPIDELPKHYADTVEVTWKLGRRYLWIDFLISAESEDLGQEIGKMTQIYHNAYCNLSATSADQGTEGLFFNRDYSRLPHIFRSSDDDCHCVISESSIRTFEKLDMEPLYRRGWVCQERLLARRNISFTEDLIFIECQSSMDCELGAPTGEYGSPFHALGIKFKFRLGDVKEYDALRKLDRRNLLPFWMAIVDFYSQSELTYLDDRLTAISGMARYIANATHIGYLAGLWNKDLVHQLPWHNRHPPTHTTISVSPKGDLKAHRAPSWSWANTDGHVEFFLRYDDIYTPTVEILETKCEGPFESKSTGFIRLHGWLLPFHKQGNVAMRPWGTSLFGSLSVDIGLTQTLQVHWDAFPLEASISAQTFRELTRDCYALPLLFNIFDLEGIIVTLTPTKEFRRVGKWCIGLLSNPNEVPAAFHTDASGVMIWGTQFVRDAPYTIRALIDVLGECDLPFLETVHEGRRLITLVREKQFKIRTI